MDANDAKVPEIGLRPRAIEFAGPSHTICLDSGADDLTLLHELYHYASTSHNDDELRAIAVSCCCYDWIPW